MPKVLKWILIVLVSLAILLFGLYKWAQSNTKKHSPEDTVVYQQGSWEAEVYYNRPYKKDREIFGGLVPYGEVWRTGANEATTFKTNRALLIAGDTLPEGKYTLWTIPGAQEWYVIFNDKMYSWGVGFDGKASRDPEFDALNRSFPVQRRSVEAEQFTIAFMPQEKGATLNLRWDKVEVGVPLIPLAH